MYTSLTCTFKLQLHADGNRSLSPYLFSDALYTIFYLLYCTGRISDELLIMLVLWTKMTIVFTL